MGFFQDLAQIEQNPRRLPVLRGAFEIHRGGLRSTHRAVSDPEVVQRIRSLRIDLEGFSKDADGFPRPSGEQKRGPATDDCVHVLRIAMHCLLQCVRGGCVVSRSQQREA